MEKNLISSLLRVYHSEKSRFAASAVLTRFVETYSIGHAKGASIVFTDRDKQDVAALLRAAEGIEAATTTSASWDALSRAESLDLGGNEKLTSAAVRQDRVAVRALPGRPLILGGKEMHLPDGANLDVEWHLASRENGHDAVLVVENWEAFAGIERTTFELSGTGANPLVLFRGSPVYRQDHVAALLEQLRLPVHAFVDFDPAGLVIALGLPGFVDLVAPAVDELERALAASTNTERFLSQLPEAQRVLDANSHPSIAAHWRMQKMHGKALPQEYFLATRATRAW